MVNDTMPYRRNYRGRYRKRNRGLHNMGRGIHKGFTTAASFSKTTSTDVPFSNDSSNFDWTDAMTVAQQTYSYGKTALGMAMKAGHWIGKATATERAIQTSLSSSFPYINRAVAGTLHSNANLYYQNYARDAYGPGLV